MAFTTLKVSEKGVLCLRGHRRRFAEGGAQALAALDAFLPGASSGVWSLHWQDGELHRKWRERSMLRQGMQLRFAPSPFAKRLGTFPKPPSPSPYDAIRQQGVVTLLVSENGERILEACSAAVVGWDGKLVVPPEWEPRVDSVAEWTLKQHLPWRFGALLRNSAMPLAMINSVAGLFPLELSGRDAFPMEIAEEISRVFAMETLEPVPVPEKE